MAALLAQDIDQAHDTGAGAGARVPLAVITGRRSTGWRPTAKRIAAGSRPGSLRRRRGTSLPSQTGDDHERSAGLRAHIEDTAAGSASAPAKLHAVNTHSPSVPDVSAEVAAMDAVHQAEINRRGSMRRIGPAGGSAGEPVDDPAPLGRSSGQFTEGNQG